MIISLPLSREQHDGSALDCNVVTVNYSRRHAPTLLASDWSTSMSAFILLAIDDEQSVSISPESSSLSGSGRWSKGGDWKLL